MMFDKKKIGLAVGAVLLAGSLQAAESLKLEEVVVTAQKRVESAQDVPVAVSAFNADSLEAMGVQDFGDLAKASPALTIQSSAQGNANESPISLRGIGTYAFSVGVESSVALVVDDVPVARSGAFFSALNDVASIEVLRGPQSTLFGKNSSAGLINVRTNDPGQEFEASVELVGTDDDEIGLKAMVSGPLTERLGVRITGYSKQRDGHITNLTDGKALNDSDDQGFRAKLVFDATDNLTATFIAEQNKSQNDCCTAVWTDVSSDFDMLAPYGPFGAVASGYLDGITPGANNRSVRLPSDVTFSKSEDKAYSLKLNYDLGDYSITSITALREWDYNWSTSFLPYLTSNGAVVMKGPYASDQFTQELRLNSPADANFQYVVGAYFTDTDSSRGFQRSVFSSDWHADTSAQAASIFGQFDLALSDRITLTAGLRYNREEFDIAFDNILKDEHYQADESDDDVFGKIAIQYVGDDDSMYYASFSQGYKGGAYDISSSFDQDFADHPVKPETVDAFEVGMKQSLMDGRVELNTALFYSEFKDFQSQTSVVRDDGSIDLTLANVGTVITKGLEMDVRALLNENWMLTGGFAYTDAEIDEWLAADCYPFQGEANGCVDGFQDLSDHEMANSPDFKASFALEYNRPIMGTNLEFFSSLAYQWQSKMFFDVKGDPATTQDAYGLANLNIGVADLDDEYRVTLFVNNLTDQYFASGMTNWNSVVGNGGTGMASVVSRDAERYIGLRVRYNF